MFGIGRRKSHGRLVRAELGEGLGHLRLAATHAAGGVGAAVGPRVDAARRSVAPTAIRVRDTAAGGWESTMTAMAPLVVAAADGARQAGTAGRPAAKSKKRATRSMRAARLKRATSKRIGRRGRGAAPAHRRWPALAGLLITGAVAAAVGAAVLRRRRESEWDAYDPAPVLETTPTEAVPVLTQSAADPGHRSAESATTSTAWSSGTGVGPAEKVNQPAAATGGTRA